VTELKLEKRNLIVQLTEEEAKQRADLAAECADVAGQAESRAALLGEQAKAAKKEAETKQKEAGKLLAVYRAKEESQLVQCRVEHNRVTDEVHVVRLDTHEIVEKRKPTQEDLNIINAKRQDAFAFDKPTRARKADKKAEPEEAKPS
jgi:hypothetical protein